MAILKHISVKNRYYLSAVELSQQKRKLALERNNIQFEYFMANERNCNSNSQ